MNKKEIIHFILSRMMSVSDYAKKEGVSPVTIYNWEREGKIEMISIGEDLNKYKYVILKDGESKEKKLIGRAKKGKAKNS